MFLRVAVKNRNAASSQSRTQTEKTGRRFQRVSLLGGHLILGVLLVGISSTRPSSSCSSSRLSTRLRCALTSCCFCCRCCLVRLFLLLSFNARDGEEQAHRQGDRDPNTDVCTPPCPHHPQNTPTSSTKKKDATVGIFICRKIRRRWWRVCGGGCASVNLDDCGQHNPLPRLGFLPHLKRGTPLLLGPSLVAGSSSSSSLLLSQAIQLLI